MAARFPAAQPCGLGGISRCAASGTEDCALPNAGMILQ